MEKSQKNLRYAKLNPQQKAFADHYFTSGNATESVYKAGYKCINNQTARSKGSTMLKNPKIRAYLDRLQEREDSIIVTNKMDTAKVLEDIIGCIGSTYNDIIVSISDGLRAIDILNKMQGSYVQKQEIDINDNRDKIDEVLARYGKYGEIDANSSAFKVVSKKVEEV